ncbi:hypothetical protein EJG51_008995 [Undibacterium piscinae]|uniref:Type II secretion system protein M n=1 Tax=Undibacterium piscinae TaxID=2495591 RepID=A0A6M4A4G4_9BURK|nr:hypothetical protein EJG51_008995 [Undibacterium piscinae]
MKQKWQLLVTKIDALSLRERGIMLVVVSLAIAYLMSTLVIEPQFIKQKKPWLKKSSASNSKSAPYRWK